MGGEAKGDLNSGPGTRAQVLTITLKLVWRASIEELLPGGGKNRGDLSIYDTCLFTRLESRVIRSEYPAHQS